MWVNGYFFLFSFSPNQEMLIIRPLLSSLSLSFFTLIYYFFLLVLGFLEGSEIFTAEIIFRVYGFYYIILISLIWFFAPFFYIVKTNWMLSWGIQTHHNAIGLFLSRGRWPIWCLIYWNFKINKKKKYINKNNKKDLEYNGCWFLLANFRLRTSPPLSNQVSWLTSSFIQLFMV